MKNTLIILLLIFFLPVLHATAQRDSLSVQQVDFYIGLIRKLKHRSHLDNWKDKRERIYVGSLPSSPVVRVCFDHYYYYMDENGNKKRSVGTDDTGPSCFTYDTVQKLFEKKSYEPITGRTTYHKAFFNDTVNVYELYTSYMNGLGFMEVYDKNGMVYRSSDTSRITFLPYPVKKNKVIAIVANKEMPVRISSYKLLAQSGKGKARRFLIEALSDSTNKFFPVESKFYIAVYKNEFKKLKAKPGKFFIELSEPGWDLVARCGYKRYFNITDMYSLDINMDSIEVVYNYKKQFQAVKKYTEMNMQGFIKDRKPGFVKRLRESKKLYCDDYEFHSLRYINKEEVEQAYEQTFSDNFIIYLNKDKIGL